MSKIDRQPECRSDYHADTGTEPERGHRIVRCGLPPHGRDVKHDEMIDGEAGLVTWDWAPPLPPRSWSLPAEPGPEVTAIRCECHGTWTADGFGAWLLTLPNSPHLGAYRLRWSDLYQGHLPLVDASPKGDPQP